VRMLKMSFGNQKAFLEIFIQFPGKPKTNMPTAF
jgi:hypothetical protein